MIQHSSQKVSTMGKDLFDLIKSIPVSNFAIANRLTGIHFPKNKDSLKNYAKKKLPKIN